MPTSVYGLLFLGMFGIAWLIIALRSHLPLPGHLAVPPKVPHPRLLKLRTPLDCPACCPSVPYPTLPAPVRVPVRPWCEIKNRRGAPKRIPTQCVWIRHIMTSFSIPHRPQANKRLLIGAFLKSCSGEALICRQPWTRGIEREPSVALLPVACQASSQAHSAWQAEDRGRHHHEQDTRDGVSDPSRCVGWRLKPTDGPG
jgi:hypothetical protein